MTAVLADMAFPRAARLVTEAHPTAALFYKISPLALFPVALLILLPRTSNDSRIALFRLAGRLPLLARYFIVALTAYGIGTIIETFIR